MMASGFVKLNRIYNLLPSLSLSLSRLRHDTIYPVADHTLSVYTLATEVPRRRLNEKERISSN